MVLDQAAEHTFLLPLDQFDVEDVRAVAGVGFFVGPGPVGVLPKKVFRDEGPIAQVDDAMRGLLGADQGFHVGHAGPLPQAVGDGYGQVVQAPGQLRGVGGDRLGADLALRLDLLLQLLGRRLAPGLRAAESDDQRQLDEC